MTSLITSLFTSSSAQLTSRLEAMRSAESSLARLARQFGNTSVGSDGVDGGIFIEINDTRIPRAVVPVKDGKCCKSSCQIGTVTSEDDHLVVHGVKVGNDGSSSSSSGGSGSPPLVLLHGYMNGSLYFYRNLFGLARHFGTVHAIDMLGWGLSSRPHFDLPDDSVETAESFFVESLEAWREENEIERMTLGGHSMGGYLSVAYAEKYPQRVERLLLLSPVGVPESDPEEVSLSRRRDVPLRYKLMFGTFRYLWSRGTTPGSFARSIPESRSRSMVDRYVEGRLPAISDPDERKILADYLYNNAMLPGSGEYCLNRILKPGAFARKPTVDRIPELKVRNVSFVYGQHDWMDPSGGLEVRRRCDELRAAGRRVPDVEVYGVRDAGHLLMLENWEEFNSAVILSAGGAISGDMPMPGRFPSGEDRRKFFRKPSFTQQSDEEEHWETTREEQSVHGERSTRVVDPVGA